MRTMMILGAGSALLLAALSFFHVEKGAAAPPFLDLGRRALGIPFWPCSTQTVDESSSCSWSGPECPSSEELRAFHEAWGKGDPMPPGFKVSQVRREISRTTGGIDWLGRHEVEMTVRVGAERLHSARLYLDDDLMSEATLDNGGVVERSDEAEATLSYFLPWLTPYTVRLVTQDSDGREEESSTTIGRLSPRPSEETIPESFDAALGAGATPDHGSGIDQTWKLAIESVNRLEK